MRSMDALNNIFPVFDEGGKRIGTIEVQRFSRDWPFLAKAKDGHRLGALASYDAAENMIREYHLNPEKFA